jgi:hypothetical protein
VENSELITWKKKSETMIADRDSRLAML